MSLAGGIPYTSYAGGSGAQVGSSGISYTSGGLSAQVRGVLTTPVLTVAGQNFTMVATPQTTWTRIGNMVTCFISGSWTDNGLAVSGAVTLINALPYPTAVVNTGTFRWPVAVAAFDRVTLAETGTATWADTTISAWIVQGTSVIDLLKTDRAPNNADTVTRTLNVSDVHSTNNGNFVMSCTYLTDAPF